MEYKKVKLSDIVPYENNPRINDGAIDAVKESIKQCGYISPIIVDENMIILAGHTRRLALMSMGVDECEIGIAAGLTEEQKKKYRLLDNKTNEFAKWDFEKLAEELEDIDFGDFDFNFDLGEKTQSNTQKEGNFEETDFDYEQKYAVSVMCKNEMEQERTYNLLTDMGYECKVVVV